MPGENKITRSLTKNLTQTGSFAQNRNLTLGHRKIRKLMNMDSKYQITMRMAPIYRKARKKDKARIRDEYMAITGLRNKKYAGTKLNRYAIDPPPEPVKRKRKPIEG